MTRDELEAKIDSLFRRYRRDAVLLHRPYPPHEAPRTNSKFGGLPRLPDRYEWPRTIYGTPLHFFAQIDCADIPFSSPLPERGVLFFFGLDDSDQAWDIDGPEGDCRVLYALDAFASTPPREAPSDLRPIRDDIAHAASGKFLLAGEAGPALHVEWPIKPLRVDSWPGFGALPEQLAEPDRRWGLFGNPAAAGQGFAAILASRARAEEEYLQEFDAYAEARAERSTASVAAAAGQALDRRGGGRDKDLEIATALLFGPDGGPGPWPDRWIHAHYFARALIHRPDYVVDAQSGPGLAAAGSDWLARSLGQPLTAEMAAADRGAFRDWVTSIRSPHDVRPIADSVARLIMDATAAAIRAWAGDRDLAALISPDIYAAMKSRLDGSSWWGPEYSQMLGHAPSTQDPLPLDDPTICLLNLASDYALGWMFGDAGHATFWISPQDLARRDFGKVRATVEDP